MIEYLSPSGIRRSVRILAAWSVGQQSHPMESDDFATPCRPGLRQTVFMSRRSPSDFDTELPKSVIPAGQTAYAALF